jgi:hypothetical protein
MELHEIIGWIGNIFVILQFTMSDMKKLRVYGVIGASVWLIVAILINNVSLMALNLIIIGIQVYHLWKIRKEEKKREHPWMYPISKEEWKDTPPIVSSLEMEEDEFIEDPFVS